MTYEYEGIRWLTYGEEGATFIPVCKSCGRFVKADETIGFNGYGQVREPNATCSKCGRIPMVFVGYV